MEDNFQMRERHVQRLEMARETRCCYACLTRLSLNELPAPAALHTATTRLAEERATLLNAGALTLATLEITQCVRLPAFLAPHCTSDCRS